METIQKIFFFCKKHIILLVLFVGIPIIILFSAIFTKALLKLTYDSQKEFRKYSLIDTKPELAGVISSEFAYRGFSYITMKDSVKIFFEYSRNDKYQPYALCFFLQSNDSLFKRANSDTLTIYRSKQKFYFLLGGRIRN